MPERLLSETDLHEGSEAYIRYCAGLAIIQFPEAFVEIHNRPDIRESADAIVISAKQLMLDGIKKIVKCSFSPEERIEMKALEGRFEEARPGMVEIVETTCLFKQERLDQLNETYKILRPAPFLDRYIYRGICHGNYQRFTANDLLDGYVPDLRLLEATDVQFS